MDFLIDVRCYMLSYGSLVLQVSFVPECIFWNPEDQNNFSVCTSNGGTAGVSRHKLFVNPSSKHKLVTISSQPPKKLMQTHRGALTGCKNTCLHPKCLNTKTTLPILKLLHWIRNTGISVSVFRIHIRIGIPIRIRLFYGGASKQIN